MWAETVGQYIVDEGKLYLGGRMALRISSCCCLVASVAALDFGLGGGGTGEESADC